MSLADLAEPPSKAQATGASAGANATAQNAKRISVQLPTSFIVLPLTAGIIGLSIGIVRGGGRARLRFLAENAHRPPKTIQGWYFYTKTRNYRVFFGAAKTGARYAAGLGGATAAYVLLDESIGWSREQIFGPVGHVEPQTPAYTGSAGGVDLGLPPIREFSLDEHEDATLAEAEGPDVEGMPARNSWRQGSVQWEDGALAGGIMGLGVGTVYRLPRQLFIRSVVMGLILGASTSALQVVQAQIGKMREAEAESHVKSLPTPSTAAAASAATTEEIIPTSNATAASISSQKDERQAQQVGAGRMDVDLIPLGEEEQSLWDKIKGFVGR